MTAPLRSRCGRAPGDEGSAAIWVLAVSSLMLLVGVVVMMRTAAVAARHRAQNSADLAALAAAGQIGVGVDPCAAARRIAEANASRMDGCEVALDPAGRSGSVTVSVSRAVDLGPFGSETASASARAGRLPSV